MEDSSQQPKDPKDLYLLKRIFFNGKKRNIVTQNINGPCPLISICNVLILREEITLHEDLAVIDFDHLVHSVGEVLLTNVPSDASESVQANYRQNISDALALMGKLASGLDVNVGFTSITDMEYSNDCLIFDLLNIKLVHGWLVDPSEKDTFEVVKKYRYNQLTEMIIDSKCMDPSSPKYEESMKKGLLAESFLEMSSHQLTYHGIFELNSNLKDDEIVIFFRNNHFSTMIKKNSGLYLLATDQGYKNEPLVWENLQNIEGDGEFVDGDFHLYVPHEATPRPSTVQQEYPLVYGQGQELSDHLLALSLQEEENKRREAARREAAPNHSNASNSSPDTNTNTNTNSNSKSKDGCTIS